MAPKTLAPKTLVVGGGIGGLCAAIALRGRGVPVEVVEQAPAFAALGAGITVQPNAHAVLQALGVALPSEDVAAMGDAAVIDRRGRPLLSAAATEGYAGPASLTLHRADLHRALLAAADGIPLRTSAAVAAITAEGDGVAVRFADGSAGRWDLVVGADGIHSVARRAVLDAADCAPRYAGQTCWRFAVEAPELAPAVTTERWFGDRRVGIVPLSRGRIYVFLVQSAPSGTPAPGSASVEEMTRRFGGIDDHLDAIMARLDDTVAVHHGDLIDLPRIDFGRGRVVLIGDAAHAMTPNTGQGAAQAIEDAGALALLVGETAPDGIAAALDAMRRARVAPLHAMSWRLGALAHWQNRFACWLRDALLRRVPARVSVKQARAMWQPGVELADRIRALG